MGLPFWIASKNLASKRLQSACAILGIAFGVACVGAVQILDHNTVRGVQEHHRRFSGNPDAILAIKDRRQLDTSAARRRLERDPMVAAFTPVLEAQAQVVLPSGQRLPVRVAAFDPDRVDDFDAYTLQAGAPLRSDDDGLLVGAWLAQTLKLNPGASITLQRPSITPAGCVEGKVVAVEGAARPAGPLLEVPVAGILERRHLGAANRGRIVVLSSGLARRLMAGSRAPETFWIRLAAGVDLDLASAEWAESFEVRIPEARSVAETPEERAFRSGVRVASLLAFGLGLFVIFHLLSLSVTTWIRQAGLLGALGVTPRRLGRIFLAEAGILSLLGTAIGLALGVGLAFVLVKLRLTTLGWGRPLGPFSVAWGELWWVPLAGIVTSLLGALRPIGRIRRVSTVDALTQGEAALGKSEASPLFAPAVLALAPLLSLSVAWLLRWVNPEILRTGLILSAIFGAFVALLWWLPGILGRVFSSGIRLVEGTTSVEPYLVRKGMERSLRRFSGAVTGLALVAAGLVTLHAITDSLKRESDEFAARAMPGHLYVDLPGVARTRLDELRAVRGVIGAYTVDAAFRDGRLLLRGVPPEQLLREGLFAADGVARESFERGNGMILSRRAAHDLGLRVGDVYRVSPLGRPVEFRILLVSDRYGYYPEERAFGLISEAAMKRRFCREAGQISHVVVSVAGPEAEDTVRLALQDEWRGSGRIWVRTAAATRQALRAEIDRDFALFDVILLLTAILGGLGLLNSLLVIGIERTKETGLLRVIGVSTSQLRRMFRMEAAMIGVASAVIGILMGVAFAAASVRGLQSLAELPLSYRFQWSWALIAGVLLVGVAVAAAQLPARRAGRADVVSAIKHE